MSSAPKKTVAKKIVAPVATVPTPTVPTPVVAAPVAAAAATVPTPVKRVAKKAPVAAATPAAPAAVPTAADVPVAVEATADAIESSWHDDLSGLNRHLSLMRDTISALFTEMKRLEKKVTRTIKDAGKRRKNRKVEGADDAPKRPTVFKIPQDVSDELNTFLGNPKGTQISRADVTRAVTGYAKEHKLMEGHNIKTDAPLAQLLKPSVYLQEGQVLSIFTLQKCLVQHYPKKVAPVA